ncbi:hypothetical protein ACFXMT_14110 [Streptomyces mirabilis]|uniref:hypothetical protein n=1 Tax=Streptomyces mirabilis TaxID=68239 RepID=UPI0036CBD5C8
MTLGLREWEWSAELRDYKPAGEYMCGWKEAVKAYYLRTGELFINQRFDPREVRMPISLPAVEPCKTMRSAA